MLQMWLDEKSTTKSSRIFAEKKLSETEHTLRGRLRNDLVYALACVGDALRMTQDELGGDSIEEVFPDVEIESYFGLMVLSGNSFAL